jgi:hypothetical protein
MRNERLFRRYRELCIASLKVAQYSLGEKGLVTWQDRGSDAQMHRMLRARSGIDVGSGFTDFAPPDLEPFFSAFVKEALEDLALSKLYSDKDLGPILIFQLTQHLRPLVFQKVLAGACASRLEETLAHCYAEFEDLLCEEDWITATIYPLVNFYSKDGWEQRQKLKNGRAIDQRTVVLDDSVFGIDVAFEIKQINPITSPLLDRSAEASSFRARSPYRDFTGDWYVIEARAPKRKMPTSQHNLTSYLIGRPMGLPKDDVSLEHRAIVDLSEYLLFALRLFKAGEVGIAPYRYISDYPRPLYVPDLYVQRYVELAQVEAYDGAPYILDSTETDHLRKLYHTVSKLLSGKPRELEHIDTAQRYFQYSYSYKLTDASRLQDRVVSLVFALEALLLEKDERRGKLIHFGDILISDKHARARTLIEDAYEVRNSVAHGRKPAIRLRKVDVTVLEDCVRYAIRRAIGLAVGRGIRSKEDLRQAIANAVEVNKGTRSENGTRQLRKDADTPFS